MSRIRDRDDKPTFCSKEVCQYNIDDACHIRDDQRYPSDCPMRDLEEEENECVHLQMVVLEEKGRRKRALRGRRDRRSTASKISRVRRNESHFCMHPSFDAEYCFVKYAREPMLGFKDCPYYEVEECEEEELTDRVEDEQG